MPTDPANITQLLHAAQAGDASALDRLFPLVYEDLHRRAAQQRAGNGGVTTMNTTAIVHEAYLKLAGQAEVSFENRAHFFAVAAKAMRHVFLDHAKRKSRQKRGGNAPHLDIQELEIGSEQINMNLEEAERVLAMEEALADLTQKNPRLGQVIECRFFGGMTVEDTAIVTNTSPATVKRDWNVARAMLFSKMSDKGLGGTE